MLTFYLKQNHGGWNSDDNQNNNLGRFRLSVTTAPDAVGRSRCPQRVREILAIPREQRTPAQVAAVFSYWRTTVPEWQRSQRRRSRRCGSSIPKGSSQLRAGRRATSRATTHMLKRGDFLKPGEPVDARRARRSCIRCPTDAPPTRLDVRPLAGRPQVADHGARRS